MLTDEQILENKNRFITLLKTIDREDADIEKLINYLQGSDFFTAPASTQYHSAFKGGLCQHSLNVYDELVKLIEMKYPKTVVDETGEMKEVENKCPYSNDTLIIVSLLHDISKTNFYEFYYRNVKDENGVWNQVESIKIRDAENRFLYSHHGANSEFMIGKFIPLSLEESIAIIHHMGWSDEHIASKNLSEIYNRYTLPLYLHFADCISTFTTERI